MKIQFFKRIDFVLLAVVLVMCLFGVVIIGSAGGWRPDWSAFSIGPVMTKQLIGLLLGLAAVVVLVLLSNQVLKFLSIPAYAGMIFILLLVLVIGVGTSEEGEAADVRRWIPFVGGITIQPSEFAKFLVILALSRFCEHNAEKISRPSRVLLYMALTAVPVFLILKEPDLSTAVVMLCICVAILFVAGLDWKYILAAVLIVAIGVWIILQDAYAEGGPKLLNEYQASRIWAFFDPQSYSQDLAYQTLRSQYAISAGGFRGLGLFNGGNLVPVPMTDCLFSILGEELGFFGASVYIVLLILLVVRILWISTKAPDLYGKCACVGVATWIAIQSLIHIGVTTAVLPNTGIPLPFMSYGASSLFSNMAGIALVMHVYADYRAQSVRYKTNEHDQYLDLSYN